MNQARPHAHPGRPHARTTLHDVVVPAVGELSIICVASVIQSSQEDLVRVAVLQVDEFPEASQEPSVTVRPVLVRQDRHLVIRLERNGKLSRSHIRIYLRRVYSCCDAPRHVWRQITTFCFGH